MSEKKVTVSAILNRSNSKVQKDRAIRIAKGMKMSYDAYKNKIIKQIFDIEEKLEEMIDISTSNVTTTGNRITGTSFNSDAFVEERSKLKLELVLKSQELKVLEEDEEFYN